MNRTRFVDWSPGSTGAANGTIQKPFRTIQDAVNAAAAMRVPPSRENPVTILIMQGVYNENVVIDQDGLILRGMGGLGSVRIRPDSGPALVVTNASAASVQQYIATGARTALASNGKASPRAVQFIDLGFESTGDAASVYVVGQPDTSRRLADEAYVMFSHCEFWGAKSLHAYFAGMLWLRHNSEVYGATEIFNCGGIWVDDSSLVDFTLAYDVKDPSGTPLMAAYGNQPGGQFGLVGNNAFVIGRCELSGNTALPPPQPTVDSTFWDIVLRQTARFDMIGGYCNSVTADGGAAWTGQNVHVQTNLTFPAGPAKSRLDGGRYMGTLTDPGNRFVRNAGK